MIGRRTGLATAQGTHQGIFDRLARDLVDETQYIADGAAASLIETPGRQGFGHRIDVFDAAIRIGTDHGVTDRLQRHLCTLLLGEYSLLGAFAFSDVRNRTLIPDDPVSSIAHCTRIF